MAVTDKIPYLQAAGIEPMVISSATGTRDDRFPHYQRMPWGPAGLRFDFRHIMAGRFGKGIFYRLTTLTVSVLLAPFIAIERLVFGVSNQASWFLPAARTGIRIGRREPIELIYSSGGAASAHHAAAIIKDKTGLPWIAEIHDPMVIREHPEDDGSAPRQTRNARYLQRLEARICREADRVWWFTEAALHYARARHPVLGDKGFAVLPGANPPDVSGTHEYGNRLRLCHFGAMTADRSLAPLIASLAAASPGCRDVIEIHAWGSELDEPSTRMLTATGLGDKVHIHDRIPRSEAVRKMFEADCLLLLHGDDEWCAEYIPSKLYDYLWARRPVFAITHRNPTLDALVARYGGYVTHTFEKASITAALEQLCCNWRARRLDPAPLAPISVEQAVATILSKRPPTI